MYLCLQKTSVALWCTVLLLWVPCTSSEASTNLNDLTSTFPSVTVDGVQPPKSTSKGSYRRSSSLTVSQVTKSSLRRQLLRRADPSDTDDGGTCGLTPSQRRLFYSRSSHTWNISDSVLEELNNDIQSVVSCAGPGDTILLPATRAIQPPRSITISTSVTLSSQAAAFPFIRNGTIVEAEKKARLHCPSSGDLLVIKSGVTLANLIFEECKGTRHVISIETKCHENSTHDTVHLRHLEFKDLTLAEDQRLLESVQPSCAHLVIENVILRNNTCGASGCMSLSLNNTLRDIQASGNQAMHKKVAMESHSVVVLPADSISVATNVSASRNRARVFSVANATLTLKGSYFERNAMSQVIPDIRTLVGGSVLVSNSSSITIEDSVFRNNSGLNGGAVYAQYSTMNIRNTSFRENKVNEAGGCIHFQYGSLYLEDVNITDNLADLYGTVLIGDSSAVFNKILFLGNSARSYGGGLSFHNSNITVRNTTFLNNSAGYSGAAIYASSRSNLHVLNTTFQNNSAESNGGGIYAWNCNVSLTETNFRNNTGDNGGGCYFNDVSAIFESVHLSHNRATNGSGGGIYTSHGSSVVISECTFSKNNAQRGAGVFSSHSSSFHVLNTSFLENNGTSGAGLFVENGNVSIELCEFRQNKANQSGSGLVAIAVNASISNSYLLDNEAIWGGACAFYNRSTVRMIGVRFVQNYGGETGGAIYTLNSRVIILSSLLHRNRADDFQDRGSFGTGDEHGCASAIYSRSGFLSLHDVNVTHNRARWSGTIYVLNSSLVFHRVLVKGNVGYEGVGVYSDHSNITVRHSSFDGNIDRGRGAAMQAMGQSRLHVFDSRIQNNIADVLGGGMYVWGGSDATLKRTNVTNNTAWGGGACVFGRGTSRMENVLFSLNRAQFLGGGIFANENTMDGKSLTFYDNHVNNEGGGIYAEFMKSMSLSNVRFYNNSGRQGGAISVHITGSSNGDEIESFEEIGVSINNSSFTSCRATLGGAIYSNSCNVKIRDTVLFSNRGKNGGGIYAVNNSRLNATNISLHSNEAVEDGGGMTIEENSSLFCTRCEFTSNEARRGGGVYALGSDFLLVVAQIQDSVFVHNRAHSYGGGLHFSRPGNTSTNCSASNIPCSRVVLLNTKFVRNVAGVSGAAVFTTDPKGVLVSCQRNDSKSTFLNEDELKSLSFVRANNTCSSWRRNRVLKSPNGDIVGTERGRKEAP